MGNGFGKQTQAKINNLNPSQIELSGWIVNITSTAVIFLFVFVNVLLSECKSSSLMALVKC